MLSLIANTMFAKTPQRYTNSALFTHGNTSIHALALSNMGDILASGGTDGTLRLWDVKSRKEIVVCSKSGLYGAISCAIWIRTKYASIETLCYGTALGFLVFLRSSPAVKQFQEVCTQRLGAGFEITCITYDPTWSDPGARVVIGMRDSVIQVLRLNANSQLQSIFSGRMNGTIPKSIAFTQRGTIYIFGLYDGNVIKMNATDGTILNEHRYDSVIGSAAVNLKRELVVVDNATNGFTLYSLDDATPIRNFVINQSSVPLPKQVAFGEDSKIVVGGSDNGFVHIFERRSGQLLTKLPHSKDGLVQTIAVRDVDGCCIIASASPAQGRRKALVRVWTHHFAAQRVTGEVKTASGPTSLLKFVLSLLLIAGALVAWQIGSFDLGQYVGSLQLQEQWCHYLVARCSNPHCSTHAVPSPSQSLAREAVDNAIRVLAAQLTNQKITHKNSHLEKRTGGRNVKSVGTVVEKTGTSKDTVIYL